LEKIMLLAMLVILAGVPVSGRVVDAQTQSPMAGVRVMLFPAEQMFLPGAMGPQQAMTDVNGQFVFDAVAPGRYRIDAQKMGFAPLAGASNSSVLEVTAGHALTGLELRLKKGGAITGRIVDAGGEPLPWIMVSALRQAADAPPGRVMATTAQMAQTNDLGEFRLASLPEGDYVVIAAPQPAPPFSQSTGANGFALAPTYYPGTANKDAAQIITLASAQTVSGLQFSLVSTPAYQVSGVVVDEAGSPVSGAMVTLMIEARNGGTGAPAMGQSDENGMFRIGGVVPGTYRLMAGTQTIWRGGSTAGGGVAGGMVTVTGGVFVGGASLGGPGVPPPPATTMATPIEVTVDNADVAGLKIVLTTRR